MQCPHCGVYFTARWASARPSFSNRIFQRWEIRATTCLACGSDIVDVYHSKQEGGEYKIPVYPRGGRLARRFPHAPGLIVQDYREACEVLDVSAKASAAMARRCLQAILKAQDYQQRDLSAQIKVLLGETDKDKVLPSALISTVDAIRQFGNFSAHPINNQTTLEIIDVEPEEAEWCLEIIEALLEHYYEMPARLEERRKNLHAKAMAAGRRSDTSTNEEKGDEKPPF